MANFRLEQRPAPLRGTGSRAQVVHWVELDSQFRSTSHTSSGSFPFREVTFHIPSTILGSWRSVWQSHCSWLLPGIHCNRLLLCLLWVMGLQQGLHFLPKMSLSKIFIYFVSVSLEDLSLVIVSHPVGYIPFCPCISHNQHRCSCILYSVPATCIWSCMYAVHVRILYPAVMCWTVPVQVE